MMYPVRHDHAVSEVIGAVLLISITVVAVSMVAVILWSQPPPQKIPSLSASIANSSCNVFLTHGGGDTVESTEISLLVDGLDQTAYFNLAGTTLPWTSWGVGQTLEYINPCIWTPQRVDIVFHSGTGKYIIATGYFVDLMSMGGSARVPGAPMVPDFSGTPTTGYAPLVVQFMDTSSPPGSPISWSWNFGDGDSTNATVQNPVHVYSGAQSYTVSLTVYNGTGHSMVTKPGYLTVTAPPPPVAAFSGTPLSGTAPLSVSFIDSSSNTPTSWKWEYRNATTGWTQFNITQNPAFTFPRGIYSINLTATTAWGSGNLTKDTYITASPNPPWYSCSWGYRKNITIDKSKVPSDQTNIPVLINLASDTDLSARARSDGYDILFTSSDGTTKLSHEIESYTSSSGALVAWVNVPTVTSATDTTIIMYYGNPASANQQDKNNVWTNSFQSVWHLSETVGGSGAIKDSTSSANHGTDQGGPTLGSAGMFGNAVTLDGLNDYINTTTSYNRPQPFTASLWFKTTNTAATRKIFGFEKNQIGELTTDWDRHIYIDTGGYVLGGVYDAGNATPRKIVATTTGGKNDGNWHYAVITYATTTTTLKLYVDGSFIGQNTTPAGAGNYVGWWRMGSFRLPAWPRSVSDGYFKGTLDEVRTSTVERSADWITTEYRNQNSPSTFYSLGNQEQWTC